MAHDLTAIIPAMEDVAQPDALSENPHPLPASLDSDAEIEIIPNAYCDGCPQQNVAGHKTFVGFRVVDGDGDAWTEGNPLPEANRFPDLSWIRYSQLFLEFLLHLSNRGFWPLASYSDFLLNAIDWWGNFAPNMIDRRGPWDVLSTTSNTITIDTSTGSDPRAAFGGRNGLSPIQVGDWVRASGDNAAAALGMDSVVTDLQGYDSGDNEIDLGPGCDRPAYMVVTVNTSIGTALNAESATLPKTMALSFYREYNFPHDWRAILPWHRTEHFFGRRTSLTFTEAAPGEGGDWDLGKFFLRNSEGDHCSVAAPYGTVDPTFGDQRTVLVEKKLADNTWEELSITQGFYGPPSDAFYVLDVLDTKEQTRYAYIHFREPVENLVVGHFTTTNCTINAVSVVADTNSQTWRLTVRATVEGEVKIELPEGVTNYVITPATPVLPDNPYLALTYNYDTTFDVDDGGQPFALQQVSGLTGGIQIAASWESEGITRSSWVNAYLTTEEVVKDLVPSAFTLTNLAMQRFAIQNGGRGRIMNAMMPYEYHLPNGDPEYANPATAWAFKSLAGAMADEAGNTSLLSGTSTGPGVEILDWQDPANMVLTALLRTEETLPQVATYPLTFTAQFSLGNTGYTGKAFGSVAAYYAAFSAPAKADFTVAGGYISSGPTSIGKGMWSFEVTPGIEGETLPDDYEATIAVTINAAASSASYDYDDGGGPVTYPFDSVESNTIEIVYNANPIAALITAEVNTEVATLSMSVPCKITFDRPVTDLSLDDFEVTNGLAANLALNGEDITSYFFTLVPDAEGTTTVKLPESTVVDFAGNDNDESNILSVIFDFAVGNYHARRLLNSMDAGDHAHTTAQSWVELRGTLQGNAGFEDLLDDATAVRVRYFYEVADNDYPNAICQSAICKHVGIDPGGVWGEDGHTEGSLANAKFFCKYSRRPAAEGGSPSAVANFSSRCYLFNCNLFEARPRSDTMLVEDNFEFALRQLWMGNPGSAVQLQPNIPAIVASFMLERRQHPSIQSMYYPEESQRWPNNGYAPVTSGLGHGAGYIGYDDSGTYRQGWGEDLSDSSATMGPPIVQPADGPFAQNDATWKTVKGIDHQLLTDTDDPTMEFRRIPMPGMWEWWRDGACPIDGNEDEQDALTPQYARGVQDQYKMLAVGGPPDLADRPENAILERIAPADDIVQERDAGRIQYGMFDADFQETELAESAVYGAIYQIDPHGNSSYNGTPFGSINPFGASTIERGMQWPHKITPNLGAGTVDIECYPTYEVVIWAFNTVPGKYIFITEYSAGANVSGLASWARMRHQYASQWRGGIGPNQGARPGYEIGFYQYRLTAGGVVYATHPDLESPFGDQMVFQLADVQCCAGDEFWWWALQYLLWWVTFDDDYLYDVNSSTNDIFYNAYMGGGILQEPKDFSSWGNKSDVLTVADPDGILAAAHIAGDIVGGTDQGAELMNQQGILSRLYRITPFLITIGAMTQPATADEPEVYITGNQQDNWQQVAAENIVPYHTGMAIYAIKTSAADAMKAVGSHCIKTVLPQGRYSTASPITAAYVNTTRNALEWANTLTVSGSGTGYSIDQVQSRYDLPIESCPPFCCPTEGHGGLVGGLGTSSGTREGVGWDIGPQGTDRDASILYSQFTSGIETATGYCPTDPTKLYRVAGTWEVSAIPGETFHCSTWFPGDDSSIIEWGADQAFTGIGGPFVTSWPDEVIAKVVSVYANITVSTGTITKKHNWGVFSFGAASSKQCGLFRPYMSQPGLGAGSPSPGPDPSREDGIYYSGALGNATICLFAQKFDDSIITLQQGVTQVPADNVAHRTDVTDIFIAARAAYISGLYKRVGLGVGNDYWGDGSMGVWPEMELWLYDKDDYRAIYDVYSHDITINNAQVTGIGDITVTFDLDADIVNALPGAAPAGNLPGMS